MLVIKQLSKEQQLLFEKYYVGENEEVKEQQLYLYKKMHGKNKKKKSLAIDKLIDITINEIALQYRRKESIESKTGLVLAFLGIVFAGFMQEDLVKNIKSIELTFWNIVFWLSILVFCFAVGFAFSVLFSKNIYGLSVKDRNNNYKNAVDDPELFKITILEIYTEAFEQNTITINKMSRNFDLCIVASVIYSCLMIFSWFY